jgi:hypothetical protein
MAEIRDYSVTADDNNAASPNGMANGCAPSTVNDTWREGIARMKRWYEDCQGAKTTTGSSNAYLLAASRVVASYAAGDAYMFKANHTNTSAGSTLNVDSVGAKAIVTPTGAAIAAGSITSGGVYLVAYEASVDKFMLIGGSHSGGDNPFIYNSSPTLTLENSTSEDTSGGRESQVVFKGLQSGSEESTLVKIQASHEGTSDDQKGQLVIGVNDGNDNDAPTTAITVASTGNTTLAGNLIIPDAGNIGSVSDTDAIAISSAGLVTVSQDLTVSDDVTIGDDLLLDSDGAVIKLGDDQDVTITHNADEGITLNSKDISGVSSINAGQIGGSRNYIYNGDTSLCQRATSVANIGNGDSGYHVQDRWKITEQGSVGGEVTMSRATEVPNGFQYSLKLDCTTTETLAADETWWLEQRLEGQDLYAWKKGTADALPVTLSFWVNATKTGTNIVSLYDADNNRHISKSYTVSSSNTWEYKTVTFAGDTTGVFDRNADVSLTPIFWLAAGSNYTSGTLATSWASFTAANAAVGQVNNLDSTSNNFHITGIQLELGETASAFQQETYGENFLRCARYYLQRAASGAWLGNSSTGTGTGGFNYSHWQFPVPMRTAPTMTGHTGTQQQINVLSGGVYNSAGSYAIWDNGSTADAEL